MCAFLSEVSATPFGQPCQVVAELLQLKLDQLAQFDSRYGHMEDLGSSLTRDKDISSHISKSGKAKPPSPLDC